MRLFECMEAYQSCYSHQYYYQVMVVKKHSLLHEKHVIFAYRITVTSRHIVPRPLCHRAIFCRYILFADAVFIVALYMPTQIFRQTCLRVLHNQLQYLNYNSVLSSRSCLSNNFNIIDIPTSYIFVNS